MAALNLEQYGITDVKEIVYNPSYEFLYEEEMKAGLQGFWMKIPKIRCGGPHRNIRMTTMS